MMFGLRFDEVLPEFSLPMLYYHMETRREEFSA
jgi:hypothetical protein